MSIATLVAALELDNFSQRFLSQPLESLAAILSAPQFSTAGIIRPHPQRSSSTAGPGLAETLLHKLIFHPTTGLCVLRKSLFGPLCLGACSESESSVQEGTPDSPRIAPRAIETLFKQALDTNYSFLSTFSMLELYVGNLRELLVAYPRRPVYHYK